MNNYKKILCVLAFVAGIYSCNSIPNKPVFEKLSTDELAHAIKSDTFFTPFYEAMRKEAKDMDDIKKAKYNDVTYRRLFSYIKYIRDTTYWHPLRKQWDNEWDSKYGAYASKADSVLNYWRKYLVDSSLSKYVNIELAKIDVEYYEYIAGIKGVNLGFRLTPLKGTVEQIRFNYGYKPKITGDDKYYEKRNCMSTSPFSSPTVRFWEVGYSDRDIFAGKTAETFLRDYNLYIEVTNIRINGENKSIDDFAVPPKVLECFENEKKYPALFEISKDELIKDLINKNYIGKYDFENKKADELREKKDKLCFDFLNDRNT